MKKGYLFSLIALTVLFILSGCKSDFEKVRISGDPAKQLKAADEYYEEGEFLKAQTLYELVLNSYRGRKEATELFYRYANTHFELQSYITAAYYFETYTNKFPTSPYKQEALYMAAISNYKLSPSYKLDQKYTQEAIDKFQLFANTYPQSEKIEQINEYIDELRIKLQKKAIAGAELYYGMESYKAAVRTYEHVLQDFPETNKAEEIRYRIANSQYKLAINSVYSKKLDRARQTLRYIKVFKEKYPQSDYMNKITNIEKNIEELIYKLENNVRYQVTSTGS